MDSPGALGRRRGTTKASAEDQALDQIAKEVRHGVKFNHFFFSSPILITHKTGIAIFSLRLSNFTFYKHTKYFLLTIFSHLIAKPMRFCIQKHTVGAVRETFLIYSLFTFLRGASKVSWGRLNQAFAVHVSESMILTKENEAKLENILQTWISMTLNVGWSVSVSTLYFTCKRLDVILLYNFYSHLKFSQTPTIVPILNVIVGWLADVCFMP